MQPAGASGLRLLFRLRLLSLLGDVIVVACLIGKALPLLGKLSPCLLALLAAAACGHGEALRGKSTVLVASVFKHLSHGYGSSRGGAPEHTGRQFNRPRLRLRIPALKYRFVPPCSCQERVATCAVRD